MSRTEKLRTFLESMEQKYHPSLRYHERAGRALEYICDQKKFSDTAFAQVLTEAEFYYQNHAQQQELSEQAHEIVDKLQIEKNPQKKKEYVAELLETLNKSLQGINSTVERAARYVETMQQKKMN